MTEGMAGGDAWVVVMSAMRDGYGCRSQGADAEQPTVAPSQVARPATAGESDLPALLRGGDFRRTMMMRDARRVGQYRPPWVVTMRHDLVWIVDGRC